jgi:hypothetical protein
MTQSDKSLLLQFVTGVIVPIVVAYIARGQPPKSKKKPRERPNKRGKRR